MAVSTALAPREGLAQLQRPTTPEQLAAAWLIGYSGSTRSAYTADLKEWGAWLASIDVEPFDVHRVHVEAWARSLEDSGRARSTITRKLAALSGFYTYAVDEDLIGRNPVDRVTRPRVDDEPLVQGLDRHELRALLDAAGRSGPRDLALATLLSLNGLRVSEALTADVSDLGDARGHRTLVIVRKGGKRALVPLAARTAVAVDGYVAGRTEEDLHRDGAPLFATSTGRRMDRQAAGKVIVRLARQAGISRTVSPHSLRHTYVTLALDAGVDLRDVQEGAGHRDPKTTIGYDRARKSLDRNPTFVVAGVVS